MLTDVSFFLFIAFVLLLVIAYVSDLPFVLIVAGIIGLFFAIQAFNETSSAMVGMSLSAVGVVTLLGGLNEIVQSAT